jgi:outer membrane protein assembly factor BamB
MLDHQILVLGIDGTLKSFDLITGKLYWESSLEMTLLDSYVTPENDKNDEYYVPTLSGDILAFSSTSIWNTTARVSDFQ